MDSKQINLALTIIKFAVIGLGVIFIAGIAFFDMNGLVGSALGITYIAMLIATVAAVGFGVKMFIEKAKESKETLYGVLGFIGLILISYLIASSDVMDHWTVVSGSVSKIVGAGLWLLYFLLFGAIGSIIYVEARKILK
ncbi:MAG: putative membrane channel-forming protein YqfA (hemolysin III family) [Flavobacteriales bacterium]|jgi:predicted membrane channel-forming protein YqfA (hemolysin III family)